MITVLLYTRPEDQGVDELRALLASLEAEVPHRLVEVDVSQNPTLAAKLEGRTPMLKIGPYTLTGTLDRTRVLVALQAASQGKAQGRAVEPRQVTGSDRFLHWFSRHWLLVFNVVVGLYVGLAFLAPVLMKVGWERPAKIIYRGYSFTCHQLAFRSWFLFGEQPAYPRAAAHVSGLVPYGQATGLDENDLLQARAFIGNDKIGYKVAMCERDVAIYGGILLFGLLFGLFRCKLPPLPWYWWLILGWLPIGLDGFSQLLSQIPHSPLPYRESTPLLRTVTGFLFGFTTAWFGYPLVEESMQESRKALEARFYIADQVAQQAIQDDKG
ncbi:MAG: DUF2085 domain-containing protein [Chloroflexi bacterium]|nr:DUF2085 domain-containing protein [Chloroflexota bacterium]